MPTTSTWGLTIPASSDPVANTPTTLATLSSQLAPGPAPVAVTFAAGWANWVDATHDAVSYQRHLGRIWFYGLARRTGATSGVTTIFTLPAGSRPARRQILVAMYNGTGVAEVAVETDGRVQCISSAATGAYVSLAGLSFRPA